MGSLGWDPPAPAPRGAQHHPPVLSMAELRLQHGVGTAAAGRLQRWGECAAASHSTWAWPWVLRLTCKKNRARLAQAGSGDQDQPEPWRGAQSRQDTVGVGPQHGGCLAGRQSPKGEHSMSQGLYFAGESFSSKLNPSEHLGLEASHSKEAPRDEHQHH